MHRARAVGHGHVWTVTLITDVEAVRGHNRPQAPGKHPREATCAKGEKYKDVMGPGLWLAAAACSLSTALPHEGGASPAAGSVHTDEHV